MSNAFDTATDANAPPPGAMAGKDSTPDQPSRSFDDLTGDPKYKSILDADTKLLDQKIGAEAGMASMQAKRDEEYRGRMDHIISVESATASELKPWNAGEELKKTKTDLWEQFGSPGFVIAMLGSAFTAMPMNSALNAGAAAMNAINAGKMDDYHKAFDAWKENSRLVEKRMELEEKQFGQIDKLRSSNMEEWRAQALALTSRFNDQRMRVLLENGMNQQYFEARDALDKVRVDHVKATELIENNEIRRQVFDALRADSKDPQKIAQAAADADMIMTAPRTPEEIVVHGLVAQPGFRDLSIEEQNKKIQDAVSGVARARYGGRANPAMNEMQKQMDAWDAANPDAPKEERDAAHNKIIGDISSAQKPSSAAPSIAKEKAQLVEDLMKQTNPATDKLYTREEALKKATEATAPPVTGNKALDAKSHIGQYDDALKLIDGIDKTLNRYVGAAGVAGRATRVGERVGNLLGSNQTDRVQMMRDISQLQLMGPRLLLDQKTGRPLSAEAAHISDIIAGLSLGDTTANTLRAMKELKERLKVIRDRDAAALGGSTVSPAAAPVETEDKPWESDPIQK
jgi:hypothetical protein